MTTDFVAAAADLRREHADEVAVEDVPLVDLLLGAVGRPEQVVEDHPLQLRPQRVGCGNTGGFHSVSSKMVGLRSEQGQHPDDVVILKHRNLAGVPPENLFNVTGSTVSPSNPNHLRREPKQQTKVA